MKKQLLFFMTLFWSVWSFGQNVTTFAGSGSSGDTDGTGAAASFTGPSGVAADAAGNIYVADRYNQKIRKITSAGVVTTFAGSGSPGSTDGTGVDASFAEPAAVATDASGNVYVADANSHKIRKITPTGVVSTFAGSGIQGSTDGIGTAASFSFPNGVAVDAFGNVYVADSFNHKIRKITSTGVVSTLAGSGSVGSADATGTASSFNLPFGVTVDASGNVYVADVNNNKIRKITAAGVVTTFAGSGSNGSADGAGTAASFSSPQGVGIDASGNVYVADIYNNKIRKITAAGVVTTFAGSGSTGSTDGIGTAASFYVPVAVTVDGSGNVYVADLFNEKIRKITPPPATHLNFDGVNDRVELPNESLYDFTNAMTVEVWMNSNVMPEQWDPLITKGDNSWRLHLNSTGTVDFTCTGTSGGGAVSTTSITDGNWHHVAGVYNGTSLKIYIDGVLENQVAATGSISNSVFPVYIGNNSDYTVRFYTGNIDEVRIWNIGRSAEQINGSKNCELQGNETGLVANYKFNQGLDAADNTSITTLTDATANGNNGTLVNFAKTGATSNFLAGSPVTTGSIVPSNATVTTPIVYTQGDTATALTATVGANGTSLVWYTTSTGGTGAATAPTPSTATVGSTSYWVSSTNANGCESARTEIVVTVNASIPATHLNFGGSNDYVDCGNSPSLQITGNTITLEAYVKFNTFGTDHWLGNIINKAAPNSNGYMLRAGGNGAVNFVVANSGWYQLTTANNAITLNTWFHIAGVYNGSTLKIYIDGVEVASTNTAISSIGNSVSNLNLGRDPQDIIRGLDASLEEVRIWNVARTAEQINGSKNCELQGTETGLVAYYKFNQGNGGQDNTAITSLTDATANGNNGTLINFTKTGTTSNFLAGSPVTTGSIVPSNATVTTPVVYTQGDTATALTATTGANGTSLVWYTTATGGTGTTAPTPSTATVGSTSYWVSSTNANGCESARTEIVVTVNALATHLNFDGVDNRVELSNESNFDFTSTFSMEAWIRVTSFTQEWQTVISKGAEGPRIHRFGVSGFIAFGTGPANDLVSTVSVNDGNWHHIAATCNNGFKSLYVDGVLQGTQIVGTPLVINNDNVRIGSQIDSYSPIRAFHGDIDEVRIWNKALTASDITNTMNCELQNTETGLVAYYKFNQGSNTGVNTGITTLTDSSGNANNGTLTNFALTGTTSNWLAGSPVVTGTTCTTLNATNFEVANNIKMYPNPTNNFVTVEVNNLTNAKLQVLDITGKVLMNQVLNTSSNTIDVQQLPTGMYLFKVSSNEGMTTSKIVKQ